MRQALLAAILLSALAACNTSQERLGGAAAGAGVGAVVGGPIGAVAGGAIGVVAGPPVTETVEDQTRRSRRR